MAYKMLWLLEFDIAHRLDPLRNDQASRRYELVLLTVVHTRGGRMLGQGEVAIEKRSLHIWSSVFVDKPNSTEWVFTSSFFLL